MVTVAAMFMTRFRHSPCSACRIEKRMKCISRPR
jgi:hypothetical protein